MPTEWHCIIREKMENRNFLKPFEVLDHPLKPLTVTVIESRGTKHLGSGSNASSSNSSLLLEPFSIALDGIDPLTQFAQESSDPLSQMAAEYEASNFNNGTDKQKAKNLSENPLLEAWSAKRTTILNKFTTSEKLSIVTSFLSGGEIIKASTTVSEKVKYRLEQLDNFEEDSIRQMMDLSQQEYVTKIEQLNQELIHAWHSDQRVKALKIAIQCSKFLADTSVMQFYPSKFVLITDILDIFGKLVYDRLRTKSEYFDPESKTSKMLPENFTPDMVPDSAKETCHNWFYKVASIRELLPRLYVEIAILKSYSFLTNTNLTETLFRLARTIRGIGDPLVAAYARCYLCRIGLNLTTEPTTFVENINDFLAVYHTTFAAGIKTELARQRIDISIYLSLYSPALDWILQCLSSRADDTLLDDILFSCQNKKNDGLLLHSILSSFRTDYISHRAMQLVNILAASTTEGITKGKLFRSLGTSLSLRPPLSDQKLEVWKKVSKIFSTFTDPNEYITCVEMWALYVAKNFGVEEIDQFLGEIISHMSPKRAFEHHYSEIQTIIDKILFHFTDICGLLVLDNFLPVIDLFQKESVKIEVCKNVANAFKNLEERNNDNSKRISDPVFTNTMMYICKILSDSVNALTVEDERRQMSSLISHFITSVSYGRDFEQQLSFYVDCRAAFQNIDTVLITLVYAVNNLAMNTRRKIRGQHTRKTATFVKACAAYSFITIPSIVSVMSRLDLYLLSSQVALLNLCLGQADACLEAAIMIIPQLPKSIEFEGKQKSTETYLISYISNFLSTLIVVPDSPEQGVLYLLRLLLETVKKYPFELNGQTLVYLHILDMLTAAAQETYPYHVPNVLSNDELYGSDPKFIAEIDAISSNVVDEILFNLKSLGDSNQTRIQGTLSIELFIRVAFGTDINNAKMFTLAINLWNLAVKNRSQLDPKLLEKTLLFVENKKKSIKVKNLLKKYDDLIVKMKSKL